MKFMLPSFVFGLFLVSPPITTLSAQSVEVCDNAIDDDGDGLVDINDEDCFCKIVEAVSLIPNPSFENQNCCPANRSQMNCADTWIQASGPTTDYIHICGWLGWDFFPLPLPIPDGEGVVGFRDGRFVSETDNTTAGDSNPNWKEYAGACLTGPLRAGVSYKFRFFIGFTQPPYSPPIDVTFFGTTNCENLPFGSGNVSFGCPTNSPEWKRLGSVIAFGENQWVEKEINVTPIEDVYAIAIGPACPERNLTNNPYYFFDNLVLAEQSAFEFDIRVNNHPCSPNLSFEVIDVDSLTYQWYKDGVALIGETNSKLTEPPGEGRYSVVFSGREGCTVTKSFFYRLPVANSSISHTICTGETYSFGNKQITQSGIYWDTLKTSENCDSIIKLELQVDNNQEEVVFAKIFPWEFYKIGNFSFGQPGEYSQTIQSSYGCDSIVNLTLEHYSVYIPNIFSPNGDGLNDLFRIMGGTDLQEINTFKIFDRWGNLVYHQPAPISNGIKASWNGKLIDKDVTEGVYLFTAKLLMNDGLEREISGMVTLIR